MLREGVILKKAWGAHPKGEIFGVLLPGEDPRPGFVDPLRAAQLLEDGFAAGHGGGPVAELDAGEDEGDEDTPAAASTQKPPSKDKPKKRGA